VFSVSWHPTQARNIKRWSSSLFSPSSPPSLPLPLPTVRIVTVILDVKPPSDLLLYLQTSGTSLTAVPLLFASLRTTLPSRMSTPLGWHAVTTLALRRPHSTLLLVAALPGGLTTPSTTLVPHRFISEKFPADRRPPVGTEAVPTGSRCD